MRTFKVRIACNETMSLRNPRTYRVLRAKRPIPKPEGNCGNFEFSRPNPCFSKLLIFFVNEREEDNILIYLLIFFKIQPIIRKCMGENGFNAGL